MNPLTNMKNVTKLSEQELYTSNKTSWHDQYRDSAWIFIGGFPYDLTEGDIICIFSQYGEIVNINLIRDKDSGKSKGFCFLCYEDQRSTILAVDNLNGIKILNRILRVDHVSDYKVPKGGKKTDDETKKLYEEGCAPKDVIPVPKVPVIKIEPQDVRETLADQIHADLKLPARLPIYPIKTEPLDETSGKVKAKKEKKVKKKKSKKKRKDSSADSSSESEDGKRKQRKKKKKSKRDTSTEESEIEIEKEEENKKLKYKGNEKSIQESNMEEKRREIDVYKRKHYSKNVNCETEYFKKENRMKRRSRSRSIEKDRINRKKYSGKYEEYRPRSKSSDRDRAHHSNKHRYPDIHKVK